MASCSQCCIAVELLLILLMRVFAINKAVVITKNGFRKIRSCCFHDLLKRKSRNAKQLEYNLHRRAQDIQRILDLTGGVISIWPPFFIFIHYVSFIGCRYTKRVFIYNFIFPYPLPSLKYKERLPTTCYKNALIYYRIAVLMHPGYM
jgi:hypothetical protein